MARLINRLSDAALKTKKEGRHPDGNCLYFNVTKFGSRNWTFIFKDPAKGGKAKEVGLGGYPGTSLAEARRKAAQFRASLNSRPKLTAFEKAITESPALSITTPTHAGSEFVPATALPVPSTGSALIPVAAPALVPTFGVFADEFVAAKVKSFSNPVHVKQWQGLAKDTVAIRELPIDQVDTKAVLAVLEPIWDAKTETADRIRGRIENILSAATVKEHRDERIPNPARWSKHLEYVLAEKTSTKNHPALPYKQMPGFMGELRKLTSISAMALEFCIHNASRTSEVIGATWSEIDINEQVWTIPAERMKAGREHIVPLNARSIAILQKLRTFSVVKRTKAVFQNGASGKGLSNMALLTCLKGLRPDATTHGMRSTFSDWAGDCSSFDAETREFALAHVIGDKAAAAYRRSTSFDKRRALLKEWEVYLAGAATPKMIVAGQRD